MTDPASYKPRQGEIPTRPGVYRFLDDRGRVLYVGKAKNLRQRLSNYFQPLRSLHERTRRMVTTASKVEWTVVSSDFESLQLEFTWINEFDPPFNVKFRDDKSYPYLAVTLGDEAPRAIVTRNHRIRKAKYFGPYPKIWAVHESLDLLRAAFPIRTCNERQYKTAMESGRPCFNGQIGRCGGPCSGTVTIEQHRAIVDEFVAFLSGGDRRIIRDMEKRMNEAAAVQDYEGAASFRDKWTALREFLGKSAVVIDDDADADVFGLEADELSAAVHQFIVRGGRIRGERSWVVDIEIDATPGEFVESILRAAYLSDEPPREVLVTADPDDRESLEVWLAERRGKGKVHVRVPQRGDKAAVLGTANLNAKESLLRYKLRRGNDLKTRSQALAVLQESLGMENAPLRIECYDVSHLQGTNVVASMVVFEDALPAKKEYRRFTIPVTTDDTDSLYQVLTRRLAYLKDDESRAPLDNSDGTARPSGFHYRPQLLLIDGGQPQVAAVTRALKESGVQGIQVAGIAKRLEELWLPDDDFPVILPRGSDALFLVQRLRDEAHRFAITHQRARRKNDIRTVLADVPGLGPARIRTLLRELGSVSALRAASPERIAEVPGIGPTLAAAIRDKLGSAAGSELEDDSPEHTDDEDGADGSDAIGGDRAASSPADASVG